MKKKKTIMVMQATMVVQAVVQKINKKNPKNNKTFKMKAVRLLSEVTKNSIVQCRIHLNTPVIRNS